MLKLFDHIKVVDANYCGFKGLSAVYLLRAPNKETMIVDTGTPKQYPLLLKALKEMDVKKEEVTTILLTHFHLDHSGGASLLSRDFPNSTIYAHPVTLERICEPTAILKHMSKVLLSRFKEEFGNNVHPIPENRCKEMKENETFNFAGYTDIQVLYTPGHSSDHVAFYNKKDSVVFTGDSFGNQYGPFTRPVYSCPFMFDAHAISKTIERITNCGAKVVAQSHIGYVTDLPDFGKKANEWAQRMGDIAIHSRYPRFEVYAEYAKAFGSDFMNDRVIRGHAHTNAMGVETVHNFVHGLPDERFQYLIK